MPEGHTIHRLAARIQRLFVGQDWRVSSPQGPFTAGAARLNGRSPRRAEAWGKHLLVHLGAEIWHVHLGLYGSFGFRGDDTFVTADQLGQLRPVSRVREPAYDDTGWILPEAPQGAVRARIQVPHGWGDLRGPVKCRVLNSMQYETLVGRLGPDPLRQPTGEINPEMLMRFRNNLARRRSSIAAALMDQSVIAGVGNVYRAEALFVEGIAPDTPAAQLDPEQATTLWSTVTIQLRTGVREGVIRTLRPADPDHGLRGADLHRKWPAGGTGTEAARHHWVYRQQHTPCLRCGQTILMRQLQGRRLYWCPGCQTR
ncbi:Fpg/Nei family DNA glycosylase [Nesterenkonia sphaerica]|uniref:DNA-(apurinic or apyrimidinic site) lyase n=1 Tax=Nesterenkonia sphaerica TaxID=1804988 RepID=A0A5R9AL71_9MICC|nr:DNA-formamidopyrimidine glycosylase family protein [Nesterenkonia sphaerica]TLP79549.1 Fpg/Nei family DNA glycosylase [Nesterenkonia sphaerica]